MASINDPFPQPQITFSTSAEPYLEDAIQTSMLACPSERSISARNLETQCSARVASMESISQVVRKLATRCNAFLIIKVQLMVIF